MIGSVSWARVYWPGDVGYPADTVGLDVDKRDGSVIVSVDLVTAVVSMLSGGHGGPRPISGRRHTGRIRSRPPTGGGSPVGSPISDRIVSTPRGTSTRTRGTSTSRSAGWSRWTPRRGQRCTPRGCGKDQTQAGRVRIGHPAGAPFSFRRNTEGIEPLHRGRRVPGIHPT